MIKKYWLILFLILSLSLSLRLFCIESESIEIDEMYNVQIVSHTYREMIEITSTDAHPPLYYIVFKTWTKYFGFSELSIRLPSVIFGFLSIIMVFLLAKEIFGIKIGLLSSFLMSIFMVDVFFSQSAKAYTMLTFFSLVSLYSFVSDKKILYIISSTILIYTHILGFFILLLEFLLFLFYYKKKHFIFSLFAIFLLYLPWIKHLIPQLRYMLNFFTMKYFDIIYLGDVFLVLGIVGTLLIVLLSYYLSKKEVIINMINSISNKTTFISDKTFLFFAFTILLIYFILLPFLISMTLIRAVIYIFPLLIIIFSWRVFTTKSKIKYVVIGLFIIINIVGLSLHYSINTNADWRGVASFLENDMKENDIFLFDKGRGYDFFSYYSDAPIEYLKLTKRGEAKEFNQYETDIISEEELLNKISNKRAWLVVWRNWRTEDYFKNILEDNIKKGILFNEIEVYLIE